jgi:hypothetical protein
MLQTISYLFILISISFNNIISVNAQQCGDEWSSFELHDDAGQSLLSVDKNNGKTTLRELIVTKTIENAALTEEIRKLREDIDALKAAPFKAIKVANKNEGTKVIAKCPSGYEAISCQNTLSGFTTTATIRNDECECTSKTTTAVSKNVEPVSILELVIMIKSFIFIFNFYSTLIAFM